MPSRNKTTSKKFLPHAFEHHVLNCQSCSRASDALLQQTLQLARHGRPGQEGLDPNRPENVEMYHFLIAKVLGQPSYNGPPHVAQPSAFPSSSIEPQMHFTYGSMPAANIAQGQYDQTTPSRLMNSTPPVNHYGSGMPFYYRDTSTPPQMYAHATPNSGYSSTQSTTPVYPTFFGHHLPSTAPSLGGPPSTFPFDRVLDPVQGHQTNFQKQYSSVQNAYPLRYTHTPPPNYTSSLGPSKQSPTDDFEMNHASTKRTRDMDNENQTEKRPKHTFPADVEGKSPATHTDSNVANAELRAEIERLRAQLLDAQNPPPAKTNSLPSSAQSPLAYKPHIDATANHIDPILGTFGKSQTDKTLVTATAHTEKITESPGRRTRPSPDLLLGDESPLNSSPVRRIVVDSEDSGSSPVRSPDDSVGKRAELTDRKESKKGKRVVKAKTVAKAPFFGTKSQSPSTKKVSRLRLTLPRRTTRSGKPFTGNPGAVIPIEDDGSASEYNPQDSSTDDEADHISGEEENSLADNQSMPDTEAGGSSEEIPLVGDQCDDIPTGGKDPVTGEMTALPNEADMQRLVKRYATYQDYRKTEIVQMMKDQAETNSYITQIVIAKAMRRATSIVETVELLMSTNKSLATAGGPVPTFYYNTLRYGDDEVTNSPRPYLRKALQGLFVMTRSSQEWPLYKLRALFRHSPTVREKSGWRITVEETYNCLLAIVIPEISRRPTANKLMWKPLEDSYVQRFCEISIDPVVYGTGLDFMDSHCSHALLRIMRARALKLGHRELFSPKLSRGSNNHLTCISRLFMSAWKDEENSRSVDLMTAKPLDRVDFHLQMIPILRGLLEQSVEQDLHRLLSFLPVTRQTLTRSLRMESVWRLWHHEALCQERDSLITRRLQTGPDHTESHLVLCWNRYSTERSNPHDETDDSGMTANQKILLEHAQAVFPFLQGKVAIGRTMSHSAQLCGATTVSPCSISESSVFNLSEDFNEIIDQVPNGKSLTIIAAGIDSFTTNFWLLVLLERKLAALRPDVRVYLIFRDAEPKVIPTATKEQREAVRSHWNLELIPRGIHWRWGLFPLTRIVGAILRLPEAKSHLTDHLLANMWEMFDVRSQSLTLNSGRNRPT